MTPEVRTCLAEMGVTREVLDRVRNARDQGEGERLLAEAKAICKRGYREAAHRCHPDIHHNSTAEVIASNEKQFKRLKSVYESFQAASYKGWRSKRSPRKGSARPADIYDYMYRDDPLMANFARLKREAQRQQRQRQEGELHDLFMDELFRKAKGRPRAERTRPFDGKRKGKTRPYRPPVELANGGGIWYPEKSRWILRTRRPKRE